MFSIRRNVGERGFRWNDRCRYGLPEREIRAFSSRGDVDRKGIGFPSTSLTTFAAMFFFGASFGSCQDASQNTSQDAKQNTKQDTKQDTKHDESSLVEDEESSSSGPSGPGDDACDLSCSPGQQDCPNPEEKCSPYLCREGCCTDATHCVPLTGTKKLGEACFRDAIAGTDDCDKALFCMPDGKTTGESGPGKCLQHCITQHEDQNSENHCLELGFDSIYRCINFNDGTFPVCLPHCDPLSPACPNEDDSCYMAFNDFFCTPFAPTMISNGNYGDPCDTEQGCKPGLACADKNLLADCQANCVGTAVCGCCTAFCDVNADNPEEKCQSPEEKCTLVFNPPPAGKEHAGICIVPN